MIDDQIDELNLVRIEVLARQHFCECILRGVTVEADQGSNKQA